MSEAQAPRGSGVAPPESGAGVARERAGSALRPGHGRLLDGLCLPTWAFLAGLLLALVVAAMLAMTLGSVAVSPRVVLCVLAAQVLPGVQEMLQGVTPHDQTIIWLIRAPRVVVAGLVGAGLAVAGAQMQGLFHNPLASPDIVGASAGAALGAVLAIAAGLVVRSLFYLPLCAFIGALLAVAVVYGLATQHGRTPLTTLLLAGVALSTLLGAATSLVISLHFFNYQVAQEILFWLMGGLDSRTWLHVAMLAPCVALGGGIALALARDFDVLLLGEEVAASLGVEVEHVKRVALASAALLTGGCVAVSGTIGFVGLVIPHMVRRLIGPTHRQLIPASALLGAVLLIIADLVARTVIQPSELRLGILTAACGAPFFLWILLRQQRETHTL